MEELKTQIITFKSDPSLKQKSIQARATNEDILNLSTMAAQVQTYPTVKIVEQEPKNEGKQKLETKPVKLLNKNYGAFPKFYKKELTRFFRIFILWILITMAIIGFESWGLYAIIVSPNVNSWLSLILIPGLMLSLGTLVLYANKYFNFRNEAKTVDFTKEKIVTINVVKLYKRLKTAYINVNWMCALGYCVFGFTIGITYLVAGFGYDTWGYFPDGIAVFNILLIISIVGLFITFFLHIFLLITNNIRAAKIDNFYNIQIVSTEELALIKKKKNRKDLIIFFLVIMFLVLIGLIIYKTVKRSAKTNIVVNN